MFVFRSCRVPLGSRVLHFSWPKEQTQNAGKQTRCTITSFPLPSIVHMFSSSCVFHTHSQCWQTHLMRFRSFFFCFAQQKREIKVFEQQRRKVVFILQWATGSCWFLHILLHRSPPTRRERICLCKFHGICPRSFTHAGRSSSSLTSP